MAETSRFWNTNDIGDGPTAGFDRDAVAGWLRNVFARGGSGVLRGVLNELAATGSASPIAVNTGAAIVYGLYYWNTASVNLTVTTPSGGTTGGRVILRASWAAQTVRLVAVRNTDGVAAIPALTQTPGTTYEISLATFTITTGGVITLTDDRGYATFSDSPQLNSLVNLAALSVIGRASNTTGTSDAISAASNGQVMRRAGTAIAFGSLATGGIADNAVTNEKLRQSAGLSVLGRTQTAAITTDITAASDGQVMRRSGAEIGFGQIATAALPANVVSDAKLRQSAGLSVIGRGANTTGDVADITAASDGQVLRRSGTTVAFGQINTDAIPDLEITAAKIAADSVDDTKAGNRVPQFYRRQGFGSSNWNAPGSDNWTPTAVRMQAGIASLTMNAGVYHENLQIVYPVVFSNIPLIFLSILDSTSTPANQYTVMVNTGTSSPAGNEFRIMLYRRVATDTDTVKVSWLAIGPE